MWLFFDFLLQILCVILSVVQICSRSLLSLLPPVCMFEIISYGSSRQDEISADAFIMLYHWVTLTQSFDVTLTHVVCLVSVGIVSRIRPVCVGKSSWYLYAMTNQSGHLCGQVHQQLCSWCLAESYRNGDQCHLFGLVARALLYVHWA